MGHALRYTDVNTPRQSLERARIKILRGPDLGSIFVISHSVVTIGRGDENDIVLRDLKSSRKHAEIAWLDTSWNVRDLGSVNGIVVNQQNVKKSVLRSGDLIAFGETEFQFITADAPTQFLKIPVNVAAQGIQRQKAQSQFQDNRLEKILNLKQGGLKGNPTALVVLIALALIGVLVFDIGDLFSPAIQEKSQSKGAEVLEKTALESPVDYAEYLPSESVEQLKKSSYPFYQSGFREYREGNFIRARQFFETALQINPSDRQAKAHLDDTIKAVDDQIHDLLLAAKNAIQAGRKSEARVNCKTVERLLAFDQDSPLLKQAKQCLEEVQKLKGGR
jgi:pSer/pThr/pTyr-binding forkhead associated (FHA) protein